MWKPVKWRISGYSLLFLIVLISELILVPVVGAENGSGISQSPLAIHSTPEPIVVLHTTPARPLNWTPSRQPDPLMSMKNITGPLAYWNEKLHWVLSDSQITEYAKKLENRMPDKYQRDDHDSFLIYNYSELAEDIGSTIGLDEEQKLAFVYQSKDLDKYRVQFMEIRGFIPPEIPHFFASGKVLDNTGRPVPGATVRFISELTVDGTNLTSTTLSDNNGNWRIKIAWGNHQNISMTRDGYDPVTREITFSNETNVMDFTLTPKPKPIPVFFPVILMAIIFGYLVIHSRKKS
ncbi:MAG: carboxypeptidase-like regulatory domain-containing protein [Methanoregula sp.]|jgi:phage anti-repressor protein